ncbi:MAG TPA: histidine kinase [Rhodospirillaceae bacterium]|nr:histidine kinase [Rhodospirillaceae bacterium]MAX63097.1 histidine kinase [Rhodospirillaceae bacterium]MBB57944.1 histidine kinase [Rhodospirillaceae bacterium]HAJ19435.1 histidine kinase [Rhodospirillaceae bacterium]HBM13601.1 histidine kinase [Rhodospirillaceae bacterium]|tara:strand:+ start:18903 stop:19172 length:270 start_codon:yes stop_codon:yes gene_type:complete
MTHFLVSEEKPDGHRLEDLLRIIRKDVLTRCIRITDDTRPEAQQVLSNNIKVLEHLSEAIKLAESSTHVLDKAFGPSQAARGGPPRIGT